MKTAVLSALLVLLSAAPLCADNFSFSLLDAPRDNAAALQLGLYPVQLFPEDVVVRGLAVGTLVVQQRNVTGLAVGVFGTTLLDESHCVAASLLLNLADRNFGVEVALVNYAEENAGAQIGLVNAAGDSGGLQVGLVNSADSGWQFGLVNCNSRSKIPCMILFNYSGNAEAVKKPSVPPVPL